MIGVRSSKKSDIRDSFEKFRTTFHNGIYSEFYMVVDMIKLQSFGKILMNLLRGVNAMWNDNFDFWHYKKMPTLSTVFKSFKTDDGIIAQVSML